METRKAFWRNIQEIFSSYSPLRMRSAFFQNSRKLFLKTFSSHFTTEDLRAVLAKKSYIFMKFLPLSLTWEKCQLLLPAGGERPVWTVIPKNFSSHLTTEEGFAVWPKTLEIFFPLLLSGDGRSVLKKDSGTISLHFPTDMRSALGRKKRKLFSKISVPTHYWRRDAQVVRFSGNFSSSLTWDKCQPPFFHYPLEEKPLFERKKDAVIRIFFSLVYLDRKRLVGRKFWIFFWFHSLPEAQCRSGPLFRKFLPFCLYAKNEDYPLKRKNPHAISGTEMQVRA